MHDLESGAHKGMIDVALSLVRWPHILVHSLNGDALIKQGMINRGTDAWVQQLGHVGVQW